MVRRGNIPNESERKGQPHWDNPSYGHQDFGGTDFELHTVVGMIRERMGISQGGLASCCALWRLYMKDEDSVLVAVCSGAGDGQ